MSMICTVTSKEGGGILAGESGIKLISVLMLSRMPSRVDQPEELLTSVLEKVLSNHRSLKFHRIFIGSIISSF